MNVCTNCGKKVNESSGFCINCSSRVTKAKNKKEFMNKRFVTRVRLILSLLLVLSIVYISIKHFIRDEPNTDVAATKTFKQSKEPSLKNNEKSNSATHSAVENIKRTPTPSSSTSNFIFPESDKKLLQEKDIATLSKAQLRLARNEIFARHGYVFNSEDLQKYFSSKSWYKANPSYKESLNKVELENIKLIKMSEDRLK